MKKATILNVNAKANILDVHIMVLTAVLYSIA